MKLQNVLSQATVGLLPSGFRWDHSAETAVLQVLSRLLEAVDKGDIGLFILLNLSAAFRHRRPQYSAESFPADL